MSDLIIDGTFIFPRKGEVLSCPQKTIVLKNRIKVKDVCVKCRNLVIDSSCRLVCRKLQVECSLAFRNSGKVEVVEIGEVLAKEFVTDENSEVLGAKMLIDSDLAMNLGVVQVTQKLVVVARERFVNRGFLSSRKLMAITAKKIVVSGGTVLGAKDSQFFCSELKIRNNCFYHNRLVVSGIGKTSSTCSKIVVATSGRVKCGEWRCNVRRFTNEGSVIVERLLAVDNCSVFSNLGKISYREKGDSKGRLVLMLEAKKFFNRGSLVSSVLQVLGSDFNNRQGGSIICRDRFGCGKSEKNISGIRVFQEFHNFGMINGGRSVLVLSKLIVNSGRIMGGILNFGSDFDDSTTDRKIRNKVTFDVLKNYGFLGSKTLCTSISFFGNVFFNHGDLKSRESIQINLNKGFCSAVLSSDFGENVKGLIFENCLNSRMISIYSPVVVCYGLKAYCNRFNEASLFSFKGFCVNVVNLRSIMTLASFDLAKFNIPNVKQLVRTFLDIPDLLEDICVNNIGLSLNIVLNFVLDILQIVIVSNPQYLMIVGIIRASFNALCFLPSTFVSMYDLALNIRTLPIYKIVAHLSSIGVYGKIVGFSVIEGLSAKSISDRVQNGGVSVLDARKMLIRNAFGSVRGVLSYLNNDTTISLLSLDVLSAGLSMNSFRMSACPVELGHFGVRFSKRTLCLSSLNFGNVLVNSNHGETSLLKLDYHCCGLAQNISLDNVAMHSLKGNQVVYGGSIHSVYYCGEQADVVLRNVQFVGKRWIIGEKCFWRLNSCTARIDNVQIDGSIQIADNEFFRLQGNLYGNGVARGEGWLLQNGNIGCNFEGNLNLLHDGQVVEGFGGDVGEYHVNSPCSREELFSLVKGTGVFANFGVRRRLSVVVNGKLCVDDDLNGRLFEQIGPGGNAISGVNVMLCATGELTMNHEQADLGYSLCLRSSQGSIVLNKKMSANGNIVLFSENENILRRNDLKSDFGDVFIFAPNGVDNVELKLLDDCRNYVDAHIASALVTIYDEEYRDVESFFKRRNLHQEKKNFGENILFPLLKTKIHPNKGFEDSVLKNDRTRCFFACQSSEKNVVVDKNHDPSSRGKENSRFVLDFGSSRMTLNKRENDHITSNFVDEAFKNLLEKGFSENDELNFSELVTNIERGKEVILGIERKEFDRSVTISTPCGGIYEEVRDVFLNNASYVSPNGPISIVAKDSIVILGDIRREELEGIDGWSFERPCFTQGKLIGNHILLKCLSGGIFLSCNVVANEVVLNAKGNIFVGNEVDIQIEEQVKRRFFGLCRKKIQVSREVESCVLHYVNNYVIESEGDVLAVGVNFFDLLGEERGTDKKDVVNRKLSSFVVKAGGNVTFQKRKLSTHRKETGFAIGLEFPFMSLNKNGKLRPNIVSFVDTLKREVDLITGPVKRILKHGAGVERIFESLFSFVHRLDWKTGNLKLYNQILKARDYLAKLRNGRFDFTLGISLNCTSVETIFQSLGLGSIHLSELRIGTPEDVVFKDNYSGDVDDCWIDARRLCFDSANLRSSVIEHSSKFGVGVSFSSESGKTARLSVGWEISGEISKETTVFHAPSHLFVKNMLHLEVDACVLEGLSLKCNSVTGRVGKLELVTLQKTSRKVEGKVSITHLGFYADGDIELSRKDDAVTTITCVDMEDFSVGELVQDEKSGFKDVNGNVVDLRLLADNVTTRKRKNVDHHLNMEFEGQWEKKEEAWMVPGVKKISSQGIQIVGDGNGSLESLSDPASYLSPEVISEQNLGTSDSEFSGVSVGADLLGLEFVETMNNDKDNNTSFNSMTDSDGKMENPDVLGSPNENGLRSEASTEMLPFVSVLSKPFNLFCLVDPVAFRSFELLKEYWSSNFQYFGKLLKHPYGEVCKPVGNWLLGRYLGGHANAQNFSMLTEPLALPYVSHISPDDGRKVALGLRNVSWNDTKVGMKEYGNVLFTPQYADVFLDIAPLIGFVKVSMELLTGRSSISGDRISVLGHLALLGMHATGQFYYCRYNSQPLRSWKIPLRNGSSVQLNGNLSHRVFRFGKHSFEEVNVGSKWKFENVQGSLSWKGKRKVGNPRWETNWDIVKDLENGIGKEIELFEKVNFPLGKSLLESSQSISTIRIRKNIQFLAKSDIVGAPKGLSQSEGSNLRQQNVVGKNVRVETKEILSEESLLNGSQSWYCSDPEGNLLVVSSTIEKSETIRKSESGVSRHGRQQWNSKEISSFYEGLKQISKEEVIDHSCIRMDVWEKLSENHVKTKNPKQCQKRYHNEVKKRKWDAGNFWVGRKPKIPKHLDGTTVSGKRKLEMWTKQETTIFYEAVDQICNEWNVPSILDVTEVNVWVLLSRNISRKTPRQCYAKFRNDRVKKKPKTEMSTRKNRRWNEKDCQRLLEGVSQVGRQWKVIAENFVFGRSGDSCNMKYDKLYSWCLDDKNINTDQWTAQENAALFLEVDYYGKDFEIASKKIGTKTESRCMDWYHNYKEKVKVIEQPMPNKFSKKEDDIIRKVVNAKKETLSWTNQYELIKSRYIKKSIPVKTEHQVRRRAFYLEHTKKTKVLGALSDRESVISAVIQKLPKVKELIAKYLEGRNIFQLRGNLYKMRKNEDGLMQMIDGDLDYLVQKFTETGDFSFVSEYLHLKIPRRFHDRFRSMRVQGKNKKWSWEDTLKLLTLRFGIEKGKPMKCTAVHMQGWSEPQCYSKIFLMNRKFPDLKREFPVDEIQQLYLENHESWGFLENFVQRWLNEPPGRLNKKYSIWYCAKRPKKKEKRFFIHEGAAELLEKKLSAPPKSKIGFTRGENSISGKKKMNMWTIREGQHLKTGIEEVFKELGLSKEDRIPFHAWEKVQTYVKSKTAERCQQKYFNDVHNERASNMTKKDRIRKKGKWTKKEIRSMLEGSSLHGRKWKLVMKGFVRRRSNKSLSHKYAELFDWCLEDPKINVDRWSSEENSKLFLEVDYNGNDFRNVSKILGTKSEEECSSWYNLVKDGWEKISSPVRFKFTEEEDAIIRGVMGRRVETMNIQSKYDLICRKFKKLKIPRKTYHQVLQRKWYLNETKEIPSKGQRFAETETVISAVIQKYPNFKELVKKHLEGKNAVQVRTHLYIQRKKKNGLVRYVDNDIELDQLFRMFGHFDFIDDYMNQRIPRRYHLRYQRANSIRCSWEEVLKLFCVHLKVERGKPLRFIVRHMDGWSSSLTGSRLKYLKRRFPKRHQEFPLKEIYKLFKDHGRTWGFLEEYTEKWLNEPPCIVTKSKTVPSWLCTDDPKVTSGLLEGENTSKDEVGSQDDISGNEKNGGKASFERLTDEEIQRIQQGAQKATKSFEWSHPFDLKVVSSIPKNLDPSTSLICTHDQKFHCDDVLSTVLLKMLPEYSNSIVFRHGVQESFVHGKIVAVYDVGGVYDHGNQLFDHHQKGYFDTFNDNYETKLAACGQIWKHLGKQIIQNRVKRFITESKTERKKLTESNVALVHEVIYQDFFEHIDAGDNGYSNFDSENPKFKVLTTLPHRVGRCNPSSFGEEAALSDTEYNLGFKKAYYLVKEEFESILTYFVGEWLHYVQDLHKDYKARREFHESGNFIFLNNSSFPSWRDAIHLFEKLENCRKEERVLFGIYFARGNYNAKVVHDVPTAPFSHRLPFPEPWRALRNSDLAKKCGVDDAIFVHASGFLACAQSLEGVLEMAEKTIQLEKSKISNEVISERAKKMLTGPEFKKYIIRVHQEIYNEKKNPNGIINLGVAESVLSYDLMKEKIVEIYENTVEGGIDEKIFGYADFTGSYALKAEICDFFKRLIFKRKDDLNVKPSDFVVCNGGGTVIESFGRFLCDKGDKILLNSPLYLAFENDLKARTRTHLVTVPRIQEMTKIGENDCSYSFKFDFEKIEENILKDPKIKAILLCNPDNPVGDSYTEADIKRFLDICYKYKIHLISDEVYCLSMIDNSKFVSAYSVVMKEKDVKKRTELLDLTHLIYSLSKDFGLNGFRVQSYMTSCSFLTLDLLEKIFKDRKFVDSYCEENQRRLSLRFKEVEKVLIKHNMKYVRPESTLFCWMKFEEIKTWEEEKTFFDNLLDSGVYLGRGKFFQSSEPGWFRLSYTGQKMETVNLGLERAFSCFSKFIESKTKK